MDFYDSDDDNDKIVIDMKNIDKKDNNDNKPNNDFEKSTENIVLEEKMEPHKKKVTKNVTVSKKDNYTSIYSKSLLTRNITLPITIIGRNLKENIENIINDYYEGKCLVEGYIKPKSSKIVTFSSGVISGDQISFEVVFECMICNPVEGMNITCLAKNITKAGIRAESATENPSPVVVFIARDHHFNNNKFINIQEGDTMVVRVIGQRFELNDPYISIIGELVSTNISTSEKPFAFSNKKQKIFIEND